MLIFSSSLKFHERWVNPVATLYKRNIAPIQLILTLFRRREPRLEIILVITFFTYFSVKYSKVIEDRKLRQVLLLEENDCETVPIF